MKPHRNSGVRWSAWLGHLGRIPLLWHGPKNCEKDKPAKESPNEQVSSNVEIPRWSYGWWTPLTIPNAIQNRVVRGDACEMNQNEANHCDDKSSPSAAQYQRGKWAFVYPNFDERDADSQNTRRQRGDVLGKIVKSAHLFFECVREDVLFLWCHMLKWPKSKLSHGAKKQEGTTNEVKAEKTER